MHDERWLVKSSGRVLGPFTLEELIQHLRARTLSIIDEVRDPNTRWSFVREHPLLREVVRQLRNEQDEGPDNTQTTFVGTATSRTTTVSITETNSQEGELTPNPSRAGASGGLGDARPINATERTIKSPFSSSNSYGSLSDTRVQKKVEKRRSFLRNVLLLGLFGVVLFGLGYFYNQKKNKGAALDQAKHALTMAREQTRYGQYEKALGYMAKARGQMVFGADDNLLYAKLLLQVDGKTVEALRALADVQGAQDPRVLREFSFIKALILLKEQRWNEASVELSNILSFNPNDDEALHNLALLQYFQGHFSTASQTEHRLWRRGYRSAELSILKGLVALREAEKAPMLSHLNQIADEMLNEMGDNFEAHFERSLIYLNLKLAAGKPDEAKTWLQSMWVADPFDSRNFTQNLLIDHQIMNWDTLMPLCRRVGQAFPDHEGAKALEAFCLALQKDNSSALRLVDEARKKLSQSTLLAAVQATLFQKMGQIDEAKVLIQLAQSEPLGLLTLGQICESQTDWPCAEQAWGQVLSVVPKNPMALYGQSVIMKQRGNENGAREQVRRGLLLSPKYRPFLASRGDVNVF